MDMPVIQPCNAIPVELVAFSDAMSPRYRKRGGFVHFFEDDSDIERFWNNPKRYLPRLSQFDGVISPDYSVCYDFPNALKVNNTYRNLASGAWLQSQGLQVIPNVGASHPTQDGPCLLSHTEAQLPSVRGRA